MREVSDPRSGETRDALATDWTRFLAAALPNAAWCPIPNLGDHAVQFVERWEIDGLVLTGGDDIGESTSRDRTERALFAHCFATGLPVMGVCRGLQRIWHELGGRLRPIAGHAGTSHLLSLQARSSQTAHDLTVNSFHRFGLDDTHVPAPLRCIGHAADGSIEAVIAEAPRLLGLMWHPERNVAPQTADIELVRWLFAHG